MLHVLGKPRAWLLAHPDAPLGATEAAAVSALLQRRAVGEPLQYILGRQEFYGLDLQVSPAVLIPRPETELLVDAVLAWAQAQPPALRIVDVGTGSGAIALALAHHLPGAALFAVDLHPEALAQAQQNAHRLALDSRIHFHQGDLLQPWLAGEAAAGFSRLDCIVSNPPYIPSDDAPTLEAQVRDFEPATALFAGPDGLEIYRRLLPQAHVVLRSGGLLALEFGFGQSDALRALLASWQHVEIVPDLAGIPRIALATRP